MIEVKKITKTYVSGDTKVNALKNVSLSFRKNEFVSILGQSGCGKTTFLNVLGGLDRYNSGDIIIDNKSTKDFKDKDWDTYRNHYVGFIFQSYNLIMHLTVLENVEIALSIAGLSNKEKKEKALKALAKVGLNDQIHKKPNQLSGGQMQRVAIARAIVNNPEIILADEPTGALDSETSVQIMNLLKEIAKDHLIIMVTHNQELAAQYSTRIISLKDGEIIGDTKPYSPRTNKKIEKKTKGKKSAMNFFTAISLSFKNLLTKKGRTFLTSFAGSIGIIGIALVLAVSNGLTLYINNVQSESLSGYPLSVSTATVDLKTFNSFSKDENDNNSTQDDYAVAYNPLQQYIKYGHYNYISPEFVSYVKDYEKQDSLKSNKQLNLINYVYSTPLKIVYKNANQTYSLFTSTNTTSVLSGSVKDVFYEELSNKEFVNDSYETIYTSSTYKEDDIYNLTLVVGKGNKISTTVLQSLGLTANSEGKLSFADICNKEFKLLYNDEYYTPDSDDFDSISSFTALDITQQDKLKGLYNDSSIKTLKIGKIIRIKEDASVSLLSSGVMFSNEFGKLYREDCENSLIAKKQLASKDAYTFFDPFKLQISEFSNLGAILPADGFKNTTEINAFLQNWYKFTLSNDEAFMIAMQQIGISSIPQSICFYPKSFDAKDNIIKMINSYNQTSEGQKYSIIYSDQTEMLTSTLGKLVNIISYVLIAFASISLVVSSIMIAIITYVSVIERTKEIGVLRSIGARKKDISRVFNSETLIIGLLSGILGVGVSYLLCIPINILIKNMAGSMLNTSIAVLSPISAIILIAISVVLTIVAGFIPSLMASKQDPVKALRSE